MQSIQIRKEVRDGVEFFVSEDGSQAGMSQLGLATFIGISRTSLSALLDKYTNAASELPDTLKTLSEQGFAMSDIPKEQGGRPVQFIPAELCEAVTYYYAFENVRLSPEVQKQARYSYRKFAAIGIKSWILQVTGFKSKSDENLKPILAQILQEMVEMKQLTSRYVTLKENTRDQAGLDEILQKYEDSNLLGDGEYFSLQSWLAAKGAVLDRGQMIQLGLLIGRTFNAHKRQPAKQDYGYNLGGTGKGKVNAYTIADIPLLESAYNTFLCS